VEEDSVGGAESVLNPKVRWLVESFPLRHKSRLTVIRNLMDWTMAVHHAAAGGGNL